ncbi:MAG: cation diffusion facilitator family transporter [Sneathiella sp.]|nr:cation diffusion facilitator family transporter [Sneathiella sp.]
MAHSHTQSENSQSAHLHNHDHAPTVTEDSERRIFWIMCLTGGYMVLQAVGGLLSGSLALIADSGHMLSDTAALGLAWFAFLLAKKPADQKRSYGYHRFQIMAAFTNGVTLFFIAGWIIFEAIQRLISPGEVLAGPMLVIAAGGLAINVAGFLVLHRGDKDNVNMQGALIHIMGDMLGSVAAIAAAIIIMLTGWMAADPLLSVLVAVIILKSAYSLVRRSGHILLEGTPDHLDMMLIRDKLIAYLPEIVDVHHMHAWSLTAEKPIVTMHIQIEPAADLATTLKQVNAFLLSEFEIDHATIQLEHGACAESSMVGADE